MTDLKHLKIPPKSKFLFYSESGEDAVDIDCSLPDRLQCLCHADSEHKFILCAIGATEWQNRVDRWQEVLSYFGTFRKVSPSSDSVKRCWKYLIPMMEAQNQTRLWRRYGNQP